MAAVESNDIQETLSLVEELQRLDPTYKPDPAYHALQVEAQKQQQDQWQSEAVGIGAVPAALNVAPFGCSTGFPGDSFGCLGDAFGAPPEAIFSSLAPTGSSASSSLPAGDSSGSSAGFGGSADGFGFSGDSIGFSGDAFGFPGDAFGMSGKNGWKGWMKGCDATMKGFFKGGKGSKKGYGWRSEKSDENLSPQELAKKERWREWDVLMAKPQGNPIAAFQTVMKKVQRPAEKRYVGLPSEPKPPQKLPQNPLAAMQEQIAVQIAALSRAQAANQSQSASSTAAKDTSEEDQVGNGMLPTGEQPQYGAEDMMKIMTMYSAATTGMGTPTQTEPQAPEKEDEKPEAPPMMSVEEFMKLQQKRESFSVESAIKKIAEAAEAERREEDSRLSKVPKLGLNAQASNVGAEQDWSSGRYVDTAWGKKWVMEGDWNCPKCGDNVFSWREACNNCLTPRPAASLQT